MAKKNKPAIRENQIKLNRLSEPVNPDDHLLGNPKAEITLVEYGSYFSNSCHVAHEVIANLRDRFDDQMRYVTGICPFPEISRLKKPQY